MSEIMDTYVVSGTRLLRLGELREGIELSYDPSDGKFRAHKDGKLLWWGGPWFTLWRVARAVLLRGDSTLPTSTVLEPEVHIVLGKWCETKAFLTRSMAEQYLKMVSPNDPTAKIIEGTISFPRGDMPPIGLTVKNGTESDR